MKNNHFETKNMRSDFLFATPSTLTGFARLLDLFGLFDDYNESATDREADARAMYSDWCIVGRDLITATKNFRDESTEQDPQ